MEKPSHRANFRVETNRRLADPSGIGRMFAGGSCALWFVSAAVAHPNRSAAMRPEGENRNHR